MKKILFGAVIAVALIGCYNDKYDKLYPAPQVTVDPCDTAANPSTYSANVKPILLQSCAISACHDGTTVAGGYDFTLYDNARTAADNGLMLADINSGTMPQGMPKLSDCKIKQITYWVNHGAANN